MSSLINTLSPSATSMIRLDHSHVLVTFHRYRPDTPAATKQALANTICAALEIHARLEEEIFYPAIRAVMPDSEVVAKSVPEHDEMRRMIAKIRAAEPGTRAYDDAVYELMRDVIHHVADEETVLLPAAERAMADQLGELGAQMTKLRLQLVGPRIGELASNMVRGMPGTTMALLAAAAGLGALVAKASGRRSPGA